MRVCVPRTGQCGLGNELLSVAKAFCASVELDMAMAKPCFFSTRKRNYPDYFPFTISDRWLHLAARFQRRQVTFTEKDYLATGMDDYGKAARAFLEAQGLLDSPSLAFYAQGMWGGFRAVLNSRMFIRSFLSQDQRTLRNHYDIISRLDPAKLTIAVHIRLDDFKPYQEPVSGGKTAWNVRLPLEWYEAVCRAVAKAFPGDVQFLLFSDGKPEELKDLVKQTAPVTSWHQKMTVCSDLLLMADADLLVCSNSSYSFWAAFLSCAPYVMFAPLLQVVAGHWCIWKEDLRVERLEGKAGGNEPWHRGVPAGLEGELPSGLKESLRGILHKKRSIDGDLILAGGVPQVKG